MRRAAGLGGRGLPRQGFRFPRGFLGRPPRRRAGGPAAGGPGRRGVLASRLREERLAERAELE
eukprot:2554019-Lingulodinium_polyedra.AAC.1